MRLILPFLLVVCFISCTKDVEEIPVDTIPDSISVHLDRTKNAIDSFTVNVNGAWTITPDTPVTWMELSATAGSGSTRIYAKTLQFNNFSTDRTATFVITNTDNPAEKVNVTITQDKYIFSPWSELFGGAQWDMMYSVSPTHDGGYIAVGNTNSSDGDVAQNNGDTDIWAVKVDAAGNMEWEKTYGGTLGDGATQIVTTANGYVIMGYTGWSIGETATPWIVKIDEEGNMIWDKTFEGVEITAIVAIPSGGFICSGGKNNDAFLLRLDDNGTTSWSKTYGGEKVDRAAGVDVTSDGGFIVVGNTNYPEIGAIADFISQDIWIFKVDADGNVLWEKKQGGSNAEWAYQVISTDDGGAIIRSRTESSDIPGYHGDIDILLTKVNVNGNLEWHKAYGTSLYENSNWLTKVDGGFILAASSGHIADGDVTELIGETDAWVVKVDGSGNIISNQIFGGPAIDVFMGMAVLNNELILTGYSMSTTGDFVTNHGSYDAWMSAIAIP